MTEVGAPDGPKAVRSASSTKRNGEWFTTEQVRGHVVDGEVAHFQVTVKVGFRLDESQAQPGHRRSGP